MSNGYEVQQLYGEGYKYKVPTYSREQVEALKHLACFSEDERKKAMFGYGLTPHGSWIGELEPLNTVPYEDIMYSLTTGEYAYQPTFENYLDSQIEYWKRSRQEATSVLNKDLATRSIAVLKDALMVYRQLKQEKDGQDE
ncbi:hypothetical protein ACSHUI_00250 [Bacillus subtilis]|uniref:hypothetical protein n=1 Tax=Bacillus subtilis TaxID=1423 RepID=UPI003CED43FA